MNTRDEYARVIQARLGELVGVARGDIPGLLAESMRYSLMAGGKRLRPVMLLAAYELAGGSALDEALDMACAVEMIHTYSLIHDDLPGMDDDTMRRGRPTNHVVYGVGQAILAGDGLLTMAFEIMLNNAVNHNDNILAHVRAMSEIARGAGVTGMVAGQCLDMASQGRGDLGEDMLKRIHRGKTMAMFTGAVRAGAILAHASDTQLNALTDYAEAFGLLFQASDDLLDITAEAGALGKSTGKDARDGKLTAVSVLGEKSALERVSELERAALDALIDFDSRADVLRALASDMAARKA